MTTLNMPDKTTSCSEDRKETCGLCYTSSVVSKLTLPCGHSVCRHCYALDLNIRDLMLTDSCHICQRNGVTFDTDLVEAKVKKSLDTLQKWDLLDTCEVTDTIKCNLLRLYNAMKKPKDEQFLTEQFCKQNGGATIMQCLKSLSEKLFGSQSRPPLQPPPSEGNSPAQHKLEVREKRGKTKGQQAVRDKISSQRQDQGKVESLRSGEVTSAAESAQNDAEVKEGYLKLFNVLLDTLLNFTYTSIQLCSGLVELGLLDILLERLHALEYDYRKDKALGVIVLDSLGIFFNCSRTDEASKWFNEKRTQTLISYMVEDRHESAVMLLALLSLCRALPPSDISQLSVPEGLFHKITNVLDNALLDDQEQHFHSFIHFNSTSSSPELDLQELLVPISKLAHHNTSYTQWVAQNDLDSLVLFMRRGSDQEIILTLEIVCILAGSRCVDFLMMKPAAIDALIDTLFTVYKYSKEFKAYNLELQVWEIQKKIKLHYQCLLAATNHTGHTCYQQGHRPPDCYFKNVLSAIHRMLKGCAEGNHLAKAKFVLDGLDKKLMRQMLGLPVAGSTLLFIAARKDSLDMVKYFIEDCGADMEQKGVYKDPDSGMSHHAPPLWVAAVEDHLSMVQFLVESGAMVNSTSDTLATPVRSACFDNNVEVVKYLVEHGADINQPNIHRGTCLMNAVRCQELVQFLIDKGAEINSQDRYGYTALHGAIMEEQEEVVKLLVKHGADIMKESKHGDDCIATACLKGQTEIVDYLLDVAKPGLVRENLAYELLGCYFIDDKYAPDKALNFWEKALQSRLDNSIPIPTFQDKHEVYGDLTEISSQEYITSLREQPDKLYRQSLLLREYIVGKYHRDTSYYVMYRGAVNADLNHYKESVELWHYGLELRHLKHQSIQSPIHDDCLFTLASFSKLFLEMKDDGATEHVTFSAIFPILQVACSEIQGVKTLMRMRPVNESTVKEVENILRLMLHIICLLVELDLSVEQGKVLEDAVSNVMEANYTDLNGRNLLHLAMLPSTSTVEGELHSTFPKVSVVALLLQCGALINWLDDRRNTPFHLLLYSDRPEITVPIVPSVSSATQESISRLMLDAGAHIDLKNAIGETVMDKLVGSHLNIGFCWADHMTLKCLAATAVKHSNLAYQDAVPKVLIPFIELH